MAAAGVPVVALLAIAASELASLSSDKGLMQDTADAVALDAANQLSFSTQASVLARAEENALRQLKAMQPRTTLAVEASIVQNGAGVKVAVNGSRLSFFGNMLPPGGFKMAVDATAMAMSTAPLCVVVLDAQAMLEIDGKAQVDAGECLVHSNGGIEAGSGSQLRALAVQAVVSAKGPGITPQAEIGAKEIADPFRSTATPLPPGCADTDKKFDKVGFATLAAGRHCGHLDIEETTVRLAPGVHVFNGEIQLKKGTKLVGDDVLIVFENRAEFKIDDKSVGLDLRGLRTGDKAMNGFVFAAAPSRTELIELPASRIERLEGVVYSPKAAIRIRDRRIVEEVLDPATSLAPVVSNQKSKWTVIVAKGLEITDEADMLVNSDYLTSAVPVPAGVGDKVGRTTRLVN